MEQPGIVGKMLTVDNWIEELQDKLTDLQWLCMWVITQTIIISNVKMNINIKITEGCGIVVNRNELSSKEANRKNQLYSSPSPGQTVP